MITPRDAPQPPGHESGQPPATHPPQTAVTGPDRKPGEAGASPIRVLQLVHTMAYGGVETTVINWARSVNASRFEMHLACFANPGSSELPFIRAVEAAGLTVMASLPWRRTKPIWTAARRLAEIIRRHRIDIVHTHNCYADLVALVARTLMPVKLITTLYVWGDFGWKRNLIQWVNQLAIRRFDRISAHCQAAVDETIARGLPRDRVQLLISGFDPDRRRLSPEERARRRREHGVGEGEVILANVARFHPEKAQDALLRSFKTIVTRHPQARLWFMGIGPLEGELRRQCAALGLERQVTFKGFVEDVPGVLPLVDIQVHPSHMEGVALAICTGMAAGLPIVASDVGGLGEVLKPGRTGVLVPPGDETRFAEEVIRLIDDPTQARKLGDAARRFIEEEYSLDLAARGVEKTYLELMGRCA